VRSPAASRAALVTHRASIDSDLAKLLETVGSYELNEVALIRTSLYPAKLHHID